MDTHAIRGLYLAMALLYGLIFGAVAVLLALLGGETTAKAILTGGATFAGTVGLILLIIGFLQPASDKQT
ncbi:MAG TPA: hypothetical protein VFC19_52285 [Candidatus Limnocylindrales bacterium]|nr:hypothetical protein [Candidatus Limnocylindrales bacterium]